MHLDISALPTPIQEQIAQIKAGEQLILTHTGKPLLSAIVQPSYANGDFNYDLERMKKAVEAPSIAVPKFDTPEQLLAWMDNLTDDDFVVGAMS